MPNDQVATSSAPDTAVPIVDVQGMSVKFVSREATVYAVNGVDFRLMPGEVLCVIGESGSGKSVSMRALMRLLPDKAQIAGKVHVSGRDVLSMTQSELTAMRGRDVSMIFQEPMTALDPVYTIGDQISETILRHEPVGRDVAMKRALDLLEFACPVSGAASEILSVRIVRRPASTRHDCDGLVMQPQAAAGRRTDDRLGCDRANSGADLAAQIAKGNGNGHDFCHP